MHPSSAKTMVANDMMQCAWTGLDGRLVFTFTIQRVSGNALPAHVMVCFGLNEAGIHRMGLPQGVTQRFDVRFPAGAYVSGYLAQKTPVHMDGADCVAVFADIHYGMNSSEGHHFEGVMAAWPICAPEPQPGPGPQLPPLPPAPCPEGQ